MLVVLATLLLSVPHIWGGEIGTYMSGRLRFKNRIVPRISPGMLHDLLIMEHTLILL